VKETDWRAELESFSKGVAEDSAEATQLVHKGLERFPKDATAQLPAGLSVGLEGLGEHISSNVDAVHVQEHLNKVSLPAPALVPSSTMQVRACLPPSLSPGC
jgi:hypothetical protein